MLKSFIMSKKMVKMVATLIILIVSMGTAYAGTVYDIDTGEPSSPYYDRDLRRYAFTSGGYRALASKFTYYEQHKIIDIKGYFATSNGGRLTAVIYTGGEDEPDTSSEISFKFNVPKDGTGWYGPTITYLNLNAGTYWIAFEVRDDDTYDGSMPTDVPNPLETATSEDRPRDLDYSPCNSSLDGYCSWGVKIGAEAETSEDWLWGYTWDTDENTYLTNSYVSLYSLDGTLESTFYTGSDSAYYYFYKPTGLYYIKAYEANHGYTLKELVAIPSAKKVINFP